jgi:hypothetical protein
MIVVNSRMSHAGPLTPPLILLLFLGDALPVLARDLAQRLSAHIESWGNHALFDLCRFSPSDRVPFRRFSGPLQSGSRLPNRAITFTFFASHSSKPTCLATA